MILRAALAIGEFITAWRGLLSFGLRSRISFFLPAALRDRAAVTHQAHALVQLVRVGVERRTISTA
jgi:hypothetical protein